MFGLLIFLSLAITSSTLSHVYFTSCFSPGWKCVDDVPNEIVFSCRDKFLNELDIVVHLKDFYTGSITEVTIHQCNSIQLFLDCPQLDVPARLEKFTIKDTRRLEFSTLTEYSSKQTPAFFTIENVNDIPLIPRGTFKSPSSALERKCFGSSRNLQAIVVTNTNIYKLEHRAMHNVTGITKILFNNVNISSIEENSIEAIMDPTNSDFLFLNSNILKRIHSSAIIVQSKNFVFSSSLVDTISSNGLNVTSSTIDFTNNTVKEIKENGLLLSGASTNISDNTFESVRSGAMLKIKCIQLQKLNKYLNIINNTMVNIETSSLYFNMKSCKFFRVPVIIRDNRMDCRCQHLSWLTKMDRDHTEINDLFLSKDNNNTCYPAPCHLPVEVVRTVQSLNMCHLNLAPQVMCYVYYDRRVNGRVGGVIKNDVDGDEDVAEPTAAFYLIQQAPSHLGSKNVIDKDAIMNDNRLNMTNRTTINMVFDMSKDFVETLRHTNATRLQGVGRTPPTGGGGAGSAAGVRRPLVPPPHCAGSACSTSVSNNRQRALDFYKYLYAQLHNDSST